MRPPSLSVFVILTIGILTVGLTSCWQQPPAYTDAERKCIAQHYTDYNAKQLDQCVDVCRACMKGNVVTCNTSCRLKGAS